MSEISSVTLLNNPGTMSLWAHTQKVATDYVAAIKLPNQEAIFYPGIDSNRSLKEVDVQLPTTKAERLVLLFRKLYVNRDTPTYDCLSGLDFICSNDDELRYEHEYSVTAHASPDNLASGQPYVVLAGRQPIHGILAVDSTNALHVAGPNSDLAYTQAADILKVWQGDLARVTAIH